MPTETLNSIMEIVRACADLQLCTFGLGQYPETRHVTNAMNRDATTLDLHFMTSNLSPKFMQLTQNPHCCLYYFNPANRHAVRLFGKIEFISDIDTKRSHWRDEYSQFGYSGADDKIFALLRFVPESYKFYIGDEMKTGNFTDTSN